VVDDVKQPMGVSGLERAFVQVPPAALGGDVLLKRTSALGEAGTTQLVRLRVAERREAWTTDVVKRRADLADAAVIGSTVTLIVGTRLVGLG
jgi:hypothetical protein